MSRAMVSPRVVAPPLAQQPAADHPARLIHPQIQERADRTGAPAHLLITYAAAHLVSAMPPGRAAQETGMRIIADLQEHVLRMMDFCGAQQFQDSADGSGAAWAKVTAEACAHVACAAAIIDHGPDAPPPAELPSVVATATYSGMVDAVPAGTHVTSEVWAAMVTRLLHATCAEPMPVQAAPPQPRPDVSATKDPQPPAPMAMRQTSAVALHHAGYPVTPEEFGFEPEVIDAMAAWLGVTADVRHLLFTLFRLRTGASVGAAAQRFGIDDTAGFPLGSLLLPTPAATSLLTQTLPADSPDLLLQEYEPTRDIHEGWVGMRRLVAIVPIGGGTRHVAVAMRINGYVLGTGAAAAAGPRESYHKLPGALLMAPPRPGVVESHIVGPATLRGEARMAVQSGATSGVAAAQDAIIARILQPADAFRAFVGGFELLRAASGAALADGHAARIVTLLAAGANLRVSVVAPETPPASSFVTISAGSAASPTDGSGEWV